MSGRSETRLVVVLMLNLILIIGLLVVGLTAGSLGVLAAGVDYLADACAIAVSILAIRLARRPPTPKHPSGYPNVPTAAALVNAGWLLVLNVAVVIAAVRRLLEGSPAVHGRAVLIASAIAAIVMIVAAVVLGGDDDEGENESAGLNRKAILLDTIADAAAAGGVAISGAIILATGGSYWLDPAVALLIAVVVGYHAIALIRKVLIALTSHPVLR